jgi:hypothetical protein
LAATGCSKADWMVRQSAMDPKGPVSQVQFDVFMATVWLALVLFVLVGGALVYAVIRYRERTGQADAPPPEQGHGNPLVEIGLIKAGKGGTHLKLKHKHAALLGKLFTHFKVGTKKDTQSQSDAKKLHDLRHKKPAKSAKPAKKAATKKKAAK